MIFQSIPSTDIKKLINFLEADKLTTKQYDAGNHFKIFKTNAR